MVAFWKGLAGSIKDELAGHDLPTTLDDVISFSYWIDIRIQARQHKI